MLMVDANVCVSARDPKEPFWRESCDFLLQVAAAGEKIVCPVLAIVEAATAAARKCWNAEIGQAIALTMQRTPLVTWQDLDFALAGLALDIGSRLFLRGADAIYAATAKWHGSTLITLDSELRQRVAVEISCLTPSEWLAKQA